MHPLVICEGFLQGVKMAKGTYVISLRWFGSLGESRYPFWTSNFSGFLFSVLRTTQHRSLNE